jgi:hypothetical protein
MNMGTWSSNWGLDEGLTSLLCKKKYVAKSREVKTGRSLAEYFKGGCGSKKGCLSNVW